MMDKVYKLSEKLLSDINTYSEQYTSPDGKEVVSDDSLRDLELILQAGFTLHKYMIEKDLWQNKPTIAQALVDLGKFMEQLQITKENAEKLHLSSTLQIWHQAKMAIAVLACNILDWRDGGNEESQ